MKIQVSKRVTTTETREVEVSLPIYSLEDFLLDDSDTVCYRKIERSTKSPEAAVKFFTVTCITRRCFGERIEFEVERRDVISITDSYLGTGANTCSEAKFEKIKAELLEMLN